MGKELTPNGGHNADHLFHPPSLPDTPLTRDHYTAEGRNYREETFKHSHTCSLQPIREREGSITPSHKEQQITAGSGEGRKAQWDDSSTPGCEGQPKMFCTGTRSLRFYFTSLDCGIRLRPAGNTYDTYDSHDSDPYRYPPLTVDPSRDQPTVINHHRQVSRSAQLHGYSNGMWRGRRDEIRSHRSRPHTHCYSSGHNVFNIMIIIYSPPSTSTLPPMTVAEGSRRRFIPIPMPISRTNCPSTHS